MYVFTYAITCVGIHTLCFKTKVCSFAGRAKHASPKKT
jgi:hypothetical protein